MAGLALLSLESRSARRIRLLFSKPLAVGAFTSTAFYTITCLDGSSTDPAISAALAVPNTTYGLELALSSDLAPGGSYTVTADAVPAGDASTTPPGTTLPLRQPERPAGPSQELSANDVLAFAYGSDIVFQEDFLETADGDLAVQSGAENVRNALARNMVSNGLPHNADFGGHPREYVDGPAAALGTLPGKLQRSLLRDDRVKRVVSVVIADEDTSDPAKAVVNASVELIGGIAVNPQITVRSG